MTQSDNGAPQVTDLLLHRNDLSEHDLQAVLGSVMAPSVDFADLYLQRVENEHWMLEENVVKQASSHLEQGFGLRVVSGEKHGFAYSDALTTRALKDAARSAKGIVNTQGEGQLSLRVNPCEPMYRSDDPITSLTDKDKVALLHDINAYARSKDARIQHVIVSLDAELSSVLLAHSSGLLGADVRPLISLHVQVLAEENGRIEQGSASMGGRTTCPELLTQTATREVVDKAVRQALLNLTSKPAPAGEMAVVLGPGWPGILLHEAVGHGLEADFNRKGSSTFSGRVGEQVASPLCTVIDDGSIYGRRGSLSMDDEGVATQATTLIEEGRLLGYMQDRQNAGLMGHDLTGNGRRESYAHLPMPRMTNTYMKGGDSNPEEVLASLDKGVYAVDFSGGQVDITSGQFVFCMSEAYWVENGKIQYPVKGATLIGNGPEVLKQVSMVGNDQDFDAGMGTCGKAGQSVPVGVGQPTLRIDNIVVGGQQIT